MEKESQWAERDWQCPSLAQEEGLITLRPHARDFHRIFKKVQRPRAYAREKAGAGLEGCGGAGRRPPTEARGSLGPGCVPPGHAVLPTHSKPHPSFSPGTRAATAPRRGSFCSYSIHGSQKSLKKGLRCFTKSIPHFTPVLLWDDSATLAWAGELCHISTLSLTGAPVHSRVDCGSVVSVRPAAC